MNSIDVYTDGSSRGNPGPGGWGALITDHMKSTVKELGGKEDPTTNNRMELMASLEALKYLEEKKYKDRMIVMHTDSAYLLQGITGWVFAWEKNGWKTKTGEDVLNKDLWEALLRVTFRMGEKGDIVWKKVEGHSGLVGNDRTDEIATGYADGERMMLFSGALSEYEKLVGSIHEKNTANATKKPSKKKSSQTAYSYVSMIEGKIKTYKTWAECEKAVKGKKGARYQKVFTQDEEHDLIGRWSLESLL